MRSLFQSSRLGWCRPPLWKNSSVPKNRRISVVQPIQIRSLDRPHWQYPFEGGRFCCRWSQWCPGGVKEYGEGVEVYIHVLPEIVQDFNFEDSPIIFHRIVPSTHIDDISSLGCILYHRISLDWYINLSIDPLVHQSIHQSINQSILPSIHQLINWSIKPSIHRSIHQLINRSIGQSRDWSIHQSIDS